MPRLPVSSTCLVSLCALITGLSACGTEPVTHTWIADVSPGDVATADNSATDSGIAADTSEAVGDAAHDASDAPDVAQGPMKSAGCGKTTTLKSGGVQLQLDAGSAGDGARGYWLSLPKNYDPSQPHKLVIGYAGTNWKGKQIQPYLALEDGASDEIHVYPDPLWRTFKNWGKLGGWVLGPHAQPADGDGDLVFTGKLIDHLNATLCIDKSRVFATGHSWGGDMAQVVACFLGDRIRASAPVAANRPYWFEKSDGSSVTCKGNAAVWTYFGQADDHFDYQKFSGQFGDECRDFWLKERKCTGRAAKEPLSYGAAGECVRYLGCGAEVRYCLYDKKAKHQVPSYYANAVRAWFRSF